jgi:ribosomal protein S18 acetylase RimI-like enzyme
VFEVATERLSGPGLDMAYHLSPWDRETVGETAAIASLTLHDAGAAADAWPAFPAWCAERGVALVSARLGHRQVAECGFLEARGFRFIELNYRPATTRLLDFAADPEVAVLDAANSDRGAIRAIAAETFEAGRFHADPMVGPAIGNRRYAAWAERAFDNPAQRVIKAVVAGRIAAFIVVESPSPAARFWSLVGLAPGLAGQGLGRRIWRTVLARHAAEGVGEVSTSISSHNHAALNLYVALGFRFPEPSTTLHWCPKGPLT